MEQEEKDALAQLGLDRRLAEAVGALDTEAATFVRIAGDENSTEEEVQQAASNYRAAVQRRNIAYDRACGIPEEKAGQREYVGDAAPLDEDALRKAVEEAVGKIEPPKATIDDAALEAAVESALAKHLPEAVKAEVAKATAGDGSERKPTGSGAKS